MERRSHIVACLAVLVALAGCHEIRPHPLAHASAEAETVTEPLITVTILGSGTPVPNRTQAGTAILIEAGGGRLLFDCGRGCTTRLAAYDPALLTRVDTVFLTHLHSDHVVGLPDLWLNGWTQGRTANFRVWGPEGAEGLFAGLREAYATDIASRTGPKGPMAPGSLQADITMIPSEGGLLMDEDGLRVTAFPVKHAGLPAFGYRIEYEGRSVVISGDTTLTPNLTEAGKDADLVLIEVASPAMVDYVRKTFPARQADAIIGLHLTAPQAASVLSEIQPGLAVYYHTVASCETDPGLLSATQEGYDGEVLVSRDLMQVRISEDGIETGYMELDPADCA